jgi:hypothetical protein
MDDLLERMGRLDVQNVKSSADILLELLSHMSVKDASGNEIKKSKDFQTAKGEIPLNVLLNDFSNFSEILASSPYTVRVNPGFVPLTVGGITFSKTYVPRDKKKLGWKALSSLCGRTFFKDIEGHTLYDRLRRSYYTSNRTKTILKINGSYFIYNDVDKTLTQVQMPSGFTDHISALDELWDEFDKVKDPKSVKQLLLDSKDSLLSGFNVVERISLEPKLDNMIETLHVLNPGYVPNISKNTSNRPQLLIVSKRPLDPSPELMEPIELMVLGRKIRPDQPVYRPPKKSRNDPMVEFGKRKSISISLKEINRLINLIKKM